MVSFQTITIALWIHQLKKLQIQQLKKLGNQLNSSIKEILPNK